MLLVLLAIGVIAFVAGSVGFKKTSKELDDALLYGGTVVSVLVLIAILVVGIVLSGRIVIDDKIAMHQEENEKIQTEVSAIVDNYMQLEEDVYTQLKNESPIVLVQLFPELKSDELVKYQLELYVNNNKKIKELKTRKLNYKPLAFWLYFGG